jgi:hypothetical protein
MQEERTLPYLVAVFVVVVVAALVIIARSLRNSELRSAYTEIIQDRKAILAGGALAAVIIVASVVQDGVTGLAGGLLMGVALGLFAATFLHRRSSDNSKTR